MNKHELSLNLLRNQLDLTPAQQLEAIERSAAQRRQRAKSTFLTLAWGGSLIAAFALGSVRETEWVGAALTAMVGAVGVALFNIWSRSANSTAKPPLPAAPEADALAELNERLANLEAILSYEEKIAARRHQAENSRATQRLGAD